MVLLMDYLLYPALIAANHWTDQELQEALPQLLSDRKLKKIQPLQKGQKDHNLQNFILRKNLLQNGVTLSVFFLPPFDSCFWMRLNKPPSHDLWSPADVQHPALPTRTGRVPEVGARRLASGVWRWKGWWPISCICFFGPPWELQ